MYVCGMQLHQYLGYALWFFLLLTIFGLFRPWLALWWADVSNRKMVLQYYGTITLALLLLYLLLKAG